MTHKEVLAKKKAFMKIRSDSQKENCGCTRKVKIQENNNGKPTTQR
jgi:hypothetical protein